MVVNFPSDLGFDFRDHVFWRSLLCFSPLDSPGSLRASDSADRNMHFRSTAPCLVLLLHLFVLERVLESNAQDQDYLQEALRTLNLPLGSDDKFRLQKNRTSDLITQLLRNVHCAERTGMTQNMCEKVRSTVHPSSSYNGGTSEKINFALTVYFDLIFW